MWGPEVLQRNAKDPGDNPLEGRWRLCPGARQIWVCSFKLHHCDLEPQLFCLLWFLCIWFLPTPFTATFLTVGAPSMSPPSPHLSCERVPLRLLVFGCEQGSRLQTDPGRKVWPTLPTGAPGDSRSGSWSPRPGARLGGPEQRQNDPKPRVSATTSWFSLIVIASMFAKDIQVSPPNRFSDFSGLAPNPQARAPPSGAGPALS